MATNWDHSNIILANQAGAYLGQGLREGMQSVARGIYEHRRREADKQREADQTAAAVEFMKANGIVRDDGEGKAAVKAAGGGAEAVRMIGAFRQEQRAQAQFDAENRRMAADVERMQREAEQARINELALSSAVAPRPYTAAEGMYLRQPGATRQPRIEEIALSYLQGGGRDQDVMKLAWEAMQREQQFRPSRINLGDGVEAMTTSPSSAVPLARGESATRQISVGGGRSLTVGPGNRYFDESGRPVEFASAAAPRPPEWTLKGSDPELYDAMRRDYLEYIRSRRGQADAPEEAGAVESTAKKGQRRRQNGRVYEYDGKQWVDKGKG